MRRQRYTATMTDGTKYVVLAYGPEDAHAFYAERGHNIARITRGDYRKDAARRHERQRADGDWNFNMPAISAAFEAMTGLSLPSYLSIKKGKRATQQQGIFEGSALSCVIRIRRTLAASDANVALWHELAHLAQYLRAANHMEWIRQEKAERRARYGYANRPTEREAREWEALAETDWLLDGKRR